jgi:hypothetical protein
MIMPSTWGKGCLSSKGYKDHRELWRTGDFATEDRETAIRNCATDNDGKGSRRVHGSAVSFLTIWSNMIPGS